MTPLQYGCLAACSPAEWQLLSNQHRSVWEGLHVLCSHLLPTEGGGGGVIQKDEMKDRIDTGVILEGVT